MKRSLLVVFAVISLVTPYATGDGAYLLWGDSQVKQCVGPDNALPASDTPSSAFLHRDGEKSFGAPTSTNLLCADWDHLNTERKVKFVKQGDDDDENGGGNKGDDDGDDEDKKDEGKSGWDRIWDASKQG